MFVEAAPSFGEGVRCSRGGVLIMGGGKLKPGGPSFLGLGDLSVSSGGTRIPDCFTALGFGFKGHLWPQVYHLR